MGKKKIVALALGFFLIFMISLLTHLPASVSLKFLPLPQGLVLSEPQGTIWQGRLRQVIWQQQNLGALSWRVHPFQLFTGKIGAFITVGQYGDLQLKGQGDVGVSFSGKPYLQNFHFTIPAQTVLEQAPLPLPATAEGFLDVVISHYDYREPYCEQAEVKSDWKNAQVSLMNQAIPLENVSLNLVCENNKITVKGQQNSQVLKSEFTVSLDANRQYKLDSWLMPAPGFPESLEKMLRMGASPDAQGRFNFRFNGRL